MGLNIALLARTRRFGGAVSSLSEQVLALAPGAMYEVSNTATVLQTVGGSPVTTDGNPVGQVSDLSSNAVNLIQSTAGSRLTYKTDGSVHWLTADATDDWVFKTTGLTLGTSFTLVLACRGSGTNGYILGLDDTGTEFGIRDLAAGYFSMQNEASGNEQITPGAGDQVITLLVSSLASAQVRVNGSVYKTFNPKDTGILFGGLAMFRYSYNNPVATSASIGARIYRLFIKPGLLTGSDLETVEAWGTEGFTV